MKVHNYKEMPALPDCPEFHFQVDSKHRGRGIGGKLLEVFVSRLSAEKHVEVGAQVTVCDGQAPLAYYQAMSLDGRPLWRVYDRRETAMYMEEEKRVWELGPLVEHVGLVADRDRLLAFVRKEKYTK
jgi:GNAT superfamily N-acetyltransferase